MKVGEKFLIIEQICEVVCTTEQGCVLEPIETENINSKLERECRHQKTKLGQFIDRYI